MAYKDYKIGEDYVYGYKEMVADAESDLALIDVSELAPGSTVFVIETGNAYMLNTQRIWKLI